MNCPCGKATNPNVETTYCKICKKLQHQYCVKVHKTMKNYECPSCFISRYDPFIKTIYYLRPSTLAYLDQDKSYHFDFPTNFLSNFNLNKTLLIFRCIKIDKKLGYQQIWPYSFNLTINDKIVNQKSNVRNELPIVLFLSDNVEIDHKFKNEQIYKFKDYINNDSSLNTNKIKLNFESNIDKGFSYVFTAEFVEFNTIDQIIYRNSSVNKSSKNFFQIARSHLKISNVEISLIDTFNNKKISLPCRSTNCTHLSVFDLKSFLIMNKNRKYNCPICNKKASDFYIDTDIRKFIDRNTGVDKILIDKNYKIKLCDKNKKEIQDKTIINLDNNANQIRQGQRPVYDNNLSDSLTTESNKNKKEILIIDLEAEPDEINCNTTNNIINTNTNATDQINKNEKTDSINHQATDFNCKRKLFKLIHNNTLFCNDEVLITDLQNKTNKSIALPTISAQNNPIEKLQQNANSNNNLIHYKERDTILNSFINDWANELFSLKNN